MDRTIIYGPAAAGEECKYLDTAVGLEVEYPQQETGKSGRGGVFVAKVIKKSTAPIYLVGIIWLLYALFFPLYRATDYALCAVISLVAFAVGKAIWPNATLIVNDPEEEKEKQPAEKKPQKTGNEEVDKLLAERERALSEMRRLNDAIVDEKISSQIDHLEEATRKIVDQVVEDPKKLPQIRRFMNYYLPTTLKILNAYDRMDSTGISGDNIDSTKERVEQLMDTLVHAFDKQLDSLFGAEALDISTDITVLENMLAREGLSGSGFGTMNQNDGENETRLK